MLVLILPAAKALDKVVSLALTQQVCGVTLAKGRTQSPWCDQLGPSLGLSNLARSVWPEASAWHDCGLRVSDLQTPSLFFSLPSSILARSAVLALPALTRTGSACSPGHLLSGEEWPSSGVPLAKPCLAAHTPASDWLAACLGTRRPGMAGPGMGRLPWSPRKEVEYERMCLGVAGPLYPHSLYSSPGLCSPSLLQVGAQLC
jgi:hypothetical protein